MRVKINNRFWLEGSTNNSSILFSTSSASSRWTILLLLLLRYLLRVNLHGHVVWRFLFFVVVVVFGLTLRWFTRWIRIELILCLLGRSWLWLRRIVLRLSGTTARVTLGKRRTLRLSYLINKLLSSWLSRALHASVVLLNGSASSYLTLRSRLIRLAFWHAWLNSATHDCNILLWFIVNIVKFLLWNLAFFLVRVADLSHLTIIVQSAPPARLRRHIWSHTLVWTSTLTYVAETLLLALAHVLVHLDIAITISFFQVLTLHVGAWQSAIFAIFAYLCLAKILFLVVNSIDEP